MQDTSHFEPRLLPAIFEERLLSTELPESLCLPPDISAMALKMFTAGLLTSLFTSSLAQTPSGIVGTPPLNETFGVSFNTTNSTIDVSPGLMIPIPGRSMPDSTRKPNLILSCTAFRRRRGTDYLVPECHCKLDLHGRDDRLLAPGRSSLSQ